MIDLYGDKGSYHLDAIAEELSADDEAMATLLDALWSSLKRHASENMEHVDNISDAYADSVADCLVKYHDYKGVATMLRHMCQELARRVEVAELERTWPKTAKEPS